MFKKKKPNMKKREKGYEMEYKIMRMRQREKNKAQDR